MTDNSSIAANLKPEQRKELFLEIQSSHQTLTAIANREGVSRKFLHQQQKKGNKALEKEFLILMDVMESPIERPSHHQKSFYSGKQKQHTLKTQVVFG